METNNQGTTGEEKKQENRESTCRDWREERRRWREERREHRHHWPFHGLFWGLGLVLVGILVLLHQTGHLSGDAWWQVLLIGLGGISLIDAFVHYSNRAYRWASWGKFVCGIVLVLVGALLLAGVSQWWPIVLIVAGGIFLARAFWRWQNVST